MATYVKGGGEPLLLMHGIISDASFFDAAAEHLCAHYKTIWYDRRGYGRSEAPANGDFSVAAQADDAARVIEEAAGEPAWVFGNSAGGLIAVELALRHPELVRGLVLLEPSLVADDASKAEIAAWNAELNGYVEGKRLKRALPAFARVVGDPNPPQEASSLAQMRQVFANLGNFMHGELNCVQRYAPPVEILQGIAAPTVVLVTRGGRQGMFGRTSEAGARALGWPVEFIDGYHNVAKDDPEGFAARLVTVLGALPRS